MQIEQNELLFWNGWIYIQTPTFFICLEAYIIDTEGNRSINTDFVYKGKGCYYDEPKLKRVNLSETAKEWIMQQFKKLTR
jgi:hypothetical protein